MRDLLNFLHSPPHIPNICKLAVQDWYVVNSYNKFYQVLKNCKDGTGCSFWVSVTPFQGFSAETAGALTLFGTGALGIPVSTTHTIAGAIMGAGATRRLSAVRWGVTRNIFISWIITIPITAIVAAVIQWILSIGFTQ